MKAFRYSSTLVFCFLLAFRTALAIDPCAQATQAVLGTNHVPATAASSYWFTFTMPDTPNKKFVLTSSADQLVQLYTKACPNIIYSSFGRHGNVDLTDIPPLTQITVQWYLTTGGDFDFNIAVADMDAGDTFGTAVLATEGTNHVPTDYSISYYYKFKMPDAAGKKLVITTNADVSISLTGSNFYYIITDGGYKSLLYTGLSANQEFYITFSGIEQGNFDWNLSIQDIVTGDDCTHAAVAAVGTNTMASSQLSSYWYTFTMPNQTGKRLVVTSSTIDRVMIATDCNDHYVTQGNGNVTANQLAPNQQVYIRWFDTGSGHNFSFNLSVDDGGPGASCSSAVAAVEGANYVSSPVSVGGYLTWYKFTMPNATGKKLVLTSSTTNNALLYYNSCDDVHYDQGYGGLIATGPSTGVGLMANQEIYILWASGPPYSFTFNLSVADIVPGDNCTNPIPAIVGNNDVPALPTPSIHWYSFQLPDKTNQRIEISALVNGNSQPLTVYTGTCDNLTLYGNYTAHAILTGLPANTKVYLAWGSTKDAFSYTLSTGDEFAGESCGKPVAAIVGTNSTNVYASWFKYTIPVNGDVTVSSVGQTTIDTYLNVFTDCNGTYAGQSDDFSALQSEVTLTLTKGTTIYIQWARNSYNHYGNLGFPFVLSVATTETATQTITFDSIPDQTTFSQPFTISATASSLLPVIFSTTDNEITLTGNQVTIVKAGAVSIAADQAGGGLYGAAAQVKHTFCITPLTPDIIQILSVSGTATLTSSSASNNQWFKNGVLIAGATNVNFSAAEAGTYTVAVIIEGCSSDPSPGVVVSVTGIEKQSDQISVYPNPFADEFTVELPTDQQASIKIIDVLGRIMYDANGTGKVLMKPSGLSSGNYILQIQGSNAVATKKVVKK